MSFVKLWPVEFVRLARAPLTRAAVLLSLLCPVLGYTFFTPAGEATDAALYLANPLLTGSLGMAFLFAALALSACGRERKNGIEPLVAGIASPFSLYFAKVASLLAAAVLTAAAVAVLYLPPTALLLGERFQIAEYLTFAGVFLLPMPMIAVLFGAGLYQLLRRFDLGFLLFAAFMILMVVFWSRGSYLGLWMDLGSTGVSDTLGNASIYRMAGYGRILWLLLAAAFWALSALFTRVYGKNGWRSLLLNLRRAYLPLAAGIMAGAGAVMAVFQPYMDHEQPLSLDESGAISTGGGMSVYMGEEAETVSLPVSSAELDLHFDTGAGTLRGTVRYRMTVPEAGSYTLEVATGCEVESVTVGGEPVPFTDLKNDYFVLMKDIVAQLPAGELEVEIAYRYHPQVAAGSEILSLYHEITPEYICLGGASLAPRVADSAEAEGCRYRAAVSLPADLELISSGETAEKLEDDGDTARWSVEGEGYSVSLFAGDYVRMQIPDTAFPVYFCYSQAYEEEFAGMDLKNLLSAVVNYCTAQYGALPYTEDYPLLIVMTSAHMMGGGASGNLSYMGETFFTSGNLQNPDKGATAAEVIAHEIIHQWWGIGQVVADPENSDWSSEALTCYATYRLMETLYGEEYAKKNYVEVWEAKYSQMRENFYIRNPQYLEMLPETQRASLDAMVFDANTYAKGPLQVLKAEERIGREALDEALRGLFTGGGTEMPPYITWQDFLDACGLTEADLSLEGGAQNG